MLVGDIGHHRTESHQRLLHDQTLDKLESRQGPDEFLRAVCWQGVYEPHHHGNDLANRPDDGAEQDAETLVCASYQRRGQERADQHPQDHGHLQQQDLAGDQIPEVPEHVEIQNVVDADHDENDQHPAEQPGEGAVSESLAQVEEKPSDGIALRSWRRLDEKGHFLLRPVGGIPDGRDHQYR